MGTDPGRSPSIACDTARLEATGADDIERAFATMRQEPPGALLVFGDSMLGVHRHQIVELAGKSRLPAIYSNREIVEAGGLMSYGTDLVASYRRVATYIDKMDRPNKRYFVLAVFRRASSYAPSAREGRAARRCG